jgi:hypothetical protein
VASAEAASAICSGAGGRARGARRGSESGTSTLPRRSDRSNGRVEGGNGPVQRRRDAAAPNGKREPL